MSYETHIMVRPDDNKCEGCGEELNGEIFESDDMVVLCKPCWDDCKLQPHIVGLLREENSQ